MFPIVTDGLPDSAGFCRILCRILPGICPDPPVESSAASFETLLETYQFSLLGKYNTQKTTPEIAAHLWRHLGLTAPLSEAPPPCSHGMDNVGSGGWHAVGEACPTMQPWTRSPLPPRAPPPPPPGGVSPRAQIFLAIACLCKCQVVGKLRQEE